MYTRTIPAVFLSFALTAGCDIDPKDTAGDSGDTGSGVGGAACLLDDDTRGLIEELATDQVFDLGYALQHTGGYEAGFSLSLIGGGDAYTGNAFLISSCVEAVTYDPYCEAEEVLDGVQRCLRFACEGAGVQLTSVWFAASGHEDPDDSAAMSYAMTQESGTATYDPRPAVTWRVVEDGEVFALDAARSSALTVALDSGSLIDLTFESALSGTRTGEEITAMAIQISLPGLVAGDEPLVVDLATDEDGHVAGAVLLGESIAATIKEGASGLRFYWETPCDE